MRFSSFIYLVGQGLHNLRANRLMTFASMGVLTVCIGTGPIGFLWLGWLADRIGAHNATALTGVLGLLALAATWRWWKEI